QHHCGCATAYKCGAARGTPDHVYCSACKATPPTGAFTQVSAGGFHTCGLKTDGTLACWGSNYSGPDNHYSGQATPPAGAFTQVSAGGFHTCGLKTDGTVACWGDDYYGQATPPAGTFAQVSAGGSHTCGLKTDGTVACWGDDCYGQATPPAGAFTQVSAGGSHSCALKSDGTVACWGNNYYGQATPPAGAFTQLSAGETHTCGLKTDGTIACWGDNRSGQATPPAGAFTLVSAGGSDTCGLKTDGSVACWGELAIAQTPDQPAAATQLVFMVQPSNTLPLFTIQPPVDVVAADAAGNTVTSFTGLVTIAIGKNRGLLMPGTLSGTKTVAAVNGAATFSDLSINQPGIGYTLVVTSPSLTGAESASFNVLTPSRPPLSGLP